MRQRRRAQLDAGLRPLGQNRRDQELTTDAKVTDTIAWPKKTRDLHNHHTDSARWDNFPFRDDDIIIATWGKCGTTWMQQIVGQLVFKGADGMFGMELSPWLDLRIMPLADVMKGLEAQQNRRFIKTHLPLDALNYSPKAKYIYVARDARDVLWSAHHHHLCFTPMAYEVFNNTPGRVGPPLEPPNPDVREAYHQFLDKNGEPYWPFWSHVQSWWDIRGLPNVMLVHYNNMKSDTKSQIGKIADFLEIEIDEDTWPAILEHCSLPYMKEQAAKIELMDQLFEGGGRNFVYKGTNGRWRDVLSPEEIRKCDDVAAANLTPDCAHWLATGELPD
jgi:aryl sulfotransferase